MKEVIRHLTKSEVIDYTRIALHAFPIDGGYTEEMVEKKANQFFDMLNQGLAATVHGLFRNNQLLGGMKCYDFQFNFHGVTALMGGLGGVAVDLLHKKERVAKGMLEHFIAHYDSKGACMVSLYAFRLDFYKKMGFGFGNKTSQYNIFPTTLIKYPSKTNIRYLTEEDLPQIHGCYKRYSSQNHGMFSHKAVWLKRLFFKGNYLVGYFKDEQLQGYLQFTFQRGDTTPYDFNLFVESHIFETRAAFFELMAFLRSQLDQVKQIIIETQDEDFHYLMTNPWNGTRSSVGLHHRTNIQEIGICYRVINVSRVFEVLKNRNFNATNLTLKITVEDSFYPKNNGSTIVQFKNGFPTIMENLECEVAITLDISDFSSMIMGAIGFKKLYDYKLANISNKIYILTVDKLFTSVKPVCISRF